MSKQTLRALPKDGSPVFEATTPLTITVNANDVARADRKDPTDCVMARAVRRCTHAHEVHVHMSRTFVRLREKGPWTAYETPQALRTEAISFDRGGKFQTGEYNLNPIRKGQKSTTRKSYAQAKTKSARLGKSKRKPPHILQDVRPHA